MDSSDENIVFDETGICNHCKEYFEKIRERVCKGEEGEKKLNEIIKKIKEDGKSKKYECIVGLSGGTDSTYLAYLAKKWGLRALIVHLDNGWNSEIATINIFKTIKKLGFDLYTYVINWEEFKDLQIAYLRASVVDIEALTDQAIKATLFKAATEKDVKYILTGTNLITEGIMPKTWGHNKSDCLNIIDIHKKFGKLKLRTYPIYNLLNRINSQFFKGIQTIEVLNYLDYNKEEAKEILKKELDWKEYPRKHGESRFTKFYQEYILPEKFKIDKRRAHLSALVCASIIKREEALKELEKPMYSEEELKIEKEYVLKKFELSEEEFDKIMKSPRKSHYDYKSSDKFFRFVRKIYLNTLGKKGV